MRLEETRPGLGLSIFLALLIFPASVGAQEAAKFYEENGTLCHTIGSGRPAAVERGKR